MSFDFRIGITSKNTFGAVYQLLCTFYPCYNVYENIKRLGELPLDCSERRIMVKQPWEIDFPSFNFDSELSQLHEKTAWIGMQTIPPVSEEVLESIRINQETCPNCRRSHVCSKRA